MQWKYRTPLLNLEKVLFKILDNSYKINGIGRLIYFHLCFYLLHPFQNWNKRTTRILEYYLLKELEPINYEFLIWIWYYFFLHSNSYYTIISLILENKYKLHHIDYFIKFYIESFKRIIKLTVKKIKISDYISWKNFTSELDKRIIEFLLENKIFTEESLLKYLNKKIINKSIIPWTNFTRFLQTEYSKEINFLYESENSKNNYLSMIYISEL